MIGKILIQALFLLLVKSDLVKYTFVIEEWVVDFMRPTISGLNDSGILPWQHPASRQQPFHIPEEQRKHALLINGMYPGPLIDVYENDTVEVTVINKMMSEATTIHWHGVHVPGTPYMDGARSVTQGPILPGESFTYKFTAWPAGSHWYHSHMDAVQASKGIKGPFVIKRRDDPYKSMYDEDIVVSVSDEWREPSVCLKLEGAMAGNPGTFLTKIQVCADVRHVTFNGQYGDGSKAYPYPTIEVESGKCYRMRYIFMGVNTENLIITMAGHQMTLIAKDGGELEPLKVKSFNMHLGNSKIS
jgi:FtsP/CotA-like multicopper oxidase with cupredoxin domain